MLLGLAAFSLASEHPNLVIIVADDLGFNDVGYNGSEIKTPRLDSLAAQGVRLNRFYAQPTCSPTRSAWMTGQMPVLTGSLLAPTGEALAPGAPQPSRYLEFMRINYREGASNNAPYKRGKGSAFEGGVRVPSVVVWPKQLKPRSVEQMVNR